MAKKQLGWLQKTLSFLLCTLLGMSLVVIVELNQVTASSPPLIEQGRELYQAGQFAQAVTVWQQALQQVEQTKENQLQQGILWNYLCLAYQQLGEWQQAQAAITSSLSLIQNSPVILAQALNTQGSLQLAQGQPELALTSWQKSAENYAQASYEPGRIGSLINQAQAMQALGLYLQARKTLTNVEQALQNQPDLQLRVTGLRSLGNILRLVGDLRDSRRVLEESLAIARNHSEANSELGAVLLSLGNTARAQKDIKAALEFYRQAATTSPSQITQVQSQLNQLSLLIETQQDVQNLLPQLQKLIANLPPSRSAVYAQINFAQSLIKFKIKPNIPLSSAQVLATAVQQAKSLQDKRAESYALGYLGELYEQTQQWGNAQELTQQAVLLAQSTNSPDIAYQWYWQLGRILKAQGEIQQATNAYQSAFNTLKSLRSDLVAINPDIQFSFREGVEPVYREYVDLLLRPQAKATLEQDNLKQAREVMESLQLAELDNFFRSACLQGQIVPIEQINQTAAAIFYPIILPDRLAVILSLPQQPLRYYSVSVPQQQVEAVLEELRQNLEKPYTTPEGKALAQQAYNWLIRPAEADLNPTQLKTLVFVLDGVLRNIPIAALYDGEQYLVEKYSIALTPGLRLLSPKPLSQSGIRALAFGLTEARHGFTALPNVGKELAAIESEVPSKVLLNQAFTSQSVQNQVDTLPFSIVHLATHGQFSSNAEETFVLAWDKPMKVNELKELLRSRDENTAEALELLVLSACETAEGDKRAALGLAGVAVEAGARSTLASLWSLDDESGARLVSEFYRELATKAVTKAEALRQAQLSLLHDPDYRHPVHWAPYVLLGNWL